MSENASHLIDTLRTTGLLTHEQLGQVPRLCSGRNVDPRALTRDLVKEGWLTVFQANQLLAGNGKELVLGPYHILDRLGQGAQSEVYKARHATHLLIVALKVIRKDKQHEHRGATRRFLQEMEAMAQLDHPNVVQFWDVDQVGSTLYCAMEFVEGTDLGKYVRLMGQLPVNEAASYIRQAALGLQHAHEHNLVHRDIKPVNLFLLSDRGAAPPTPGSGLIKILDWGLACLRPTQEAPSAGSPAKPMRTVTGSADYLAPEQARDLNSADIRSDIYSLGCTCHYLLTGQPPFPNGSLAQKIKQHEEAEPPPISEFNPVVTAELQAIVRRMMTKGPADRFQTPAAVAMALTPFCRGPQARPVACDAR